MNRQLKTGLSWSLHSLLRSFLLILPRTFLRITGTALLVFSQLTAQGATQLDSKLESGSIGSSLYRAQLEMTHLLVSKVLLFQMIDNDILLIEVPFRGGKHTSEITEKHYHLLLAKKYYLNLLHEWKKSINEADLSGDPKQWPSGKDLFIKAAEANAFLKTNTFILNSLIAGDNKYLFFTNARDRMIRVILDNDTRLKDRINTDPESIDRLTDGQREKELIDSLHFYFAFASKDRRLHVSLLLFLAHHKNPAVVEAACDVLNRLSLYVDPIGTMVDKLTDLKKSLGFKKDSAPSSSSIAQKRKWVIFAMMGASLALAPEIGASASIVALGHSALYQFLLHRKSGAIGDGKTEGEGDPLKDIYNTELVAKNLLSTQTQDRISQFLQTQSAYEDLSQTFSYSNPDWIDRFSLSLPLIDRETLNRKLTTILNTALPSGLSANGKLIGENLELILTAEAQRFSQSHFKDRRLFSMALAGYKTTLAKALALRDQSLRDHSSRDSSLGQKALQAPSKENSKSKIKSHSIGRLESEPFVTQTLIRQVMDLIQTRHNFYYLAGSPSPTRALLSEGGNCVTETIIKASLFSQILENTPWTVGVSFLRSHVRAVLVNQKTQTVLELDGSTPRSQSLKDYPNSIFYGQILLFNELENSNLKPHQFELYRPSSSEGNRPSLGSDDSGFRFFKNVVPSSYISKEVLPNEENNPAFSLTGQSEPSSNLGGIGREDRIGEPSYSGSSGNSSSQRKSDGLSQSQRFRPFPTSSSTPEGEFTPLFLKASSLQGAWKTMDQYIQKEIQGPATMSFINDSAGPMDEPPSVPMNRKCLRFYGLLPKCVYFRSVLLKTERETPQSDPEISNFASSVYLKEKYLNEKNKDFQIRISTPKVFVNSSSGEEIIVTLYTRDSKLQKLGTDPDFAALVLTRSLNAEFSQFGDDLKKWVLPELRNLTTQFDKIGSAGELVIHPSFQKILKELSQFSLFSERARYLYQILFITNPDLLNHFENLLGLPETFLVAVKTESDVDRDSEDKMEVVNFPRQQLVARSIFGGSRRNQDPRTMYALQAMMFGENRGLTLPHLNPQLLEALIPSAILQKGNMSAVYAFSDWMRGAQSPAMGPHDGVHLLPILYSGETESSASREGSFYNLDLGTRRIPMVQQGRHYAMLNDFGYDFLNLKDGVPVVDAHRWNPTSKKSLQDFLLGFKITNSYFSQHPVQMRLISILQTLGESSRRSPLAQFLDSYTLNLTRKEYFQTADWQRLFVNNGLTHMFETYFITYPTIQLSQCRSEGPADKIELPRLSPELCNSVNSNDGVLICRKRGSLSSTRGSQNSAKSNENICRSPHIPFNPTVTYQTNSNQPQSNGTPISFETFLGGHLSKSQEDLSNNRSDRLFMIYVDDKMTQHISKNKTYYQTYWKEELSKLCKIIQNGQQYRWNQKCKSLNDSDSKFRDELDSESEMDQVPVPNDHWPALLRLRTALNTMGLCESVTEGQSSSENGARSDNDSHPNIQDQLEPDCSVETGNGKGLRGHRSINKNQGGMAPEDFSFGLTPKN